LDIKAIVQNPQVAITHTWGSLQACPCADDIQRLADELLDLKVAIKQLKQSKGQLSSQFKQAKDNPEHLQQLKEAMAAVSAQLANQEKVRKILENQLLAPFSAQSLSPAPQFPKRFLIHYPDQAASPAVTVAQISDEDEVGWNSYATAHEKTSLYHLYHWKHVIERALGHTCYYYAAKTSDGRIVGILPLIGIQSRLFGGYAVSMPFFNYGGVVADSRPIADHLINTANADAEKYGWQHIEYRSCEEGFNLPSTSRKVSMILNLPSSVEQLEGSLRAKVRAQCKQARRYRPAIRLGGLELLDDYYRVFSRNMRDLGTPVYSKDFFATILQELPAHCTLVSVRIGQKPVATAFLTAYRETLEIPWASTLREFNDCNINMWMYRQILAHAVETGYEFFDFGRSTVDAGTYHFKKQWGAKAVRHYWYYYLRQQPVQQRTNLPELNPDNLKYRFAIAAWKRLPLFLANSLGPHIVKNLP
jgi:serine/alanine adding enzyme